jgi:GGDEF domain-containing protein
VLHKIGSYFKKFSEEKGFELYRYGGEEFIGLYRAPTGIDYANAMHQLCKEVRDLKIERALPLKLKTPPSSSPSPD